MPTKTNATGEDDRSYLSSVSETLASLVKRPLLLFAVIMLINAVARPYEGLVHDARLYAVQTLNRLDGAYANDLYLRYGSQDSYSTFSTMIQPLVRTIGLEATFFSLYLTSASLFYFALMRIVLRLVTHPLYAVCGLLFVATSPIWFGGLSVFRVNEPFLTPRFLSNALVLLACDRMLCDRMTGALVLLVVALAFHPLMAFGGLLVWVLMMLFRHLSPRTVAYVLGVAAIIALVPIANRSVGFRIFGEMDAEWRSIADLVSYYALPSEWHMQDWLRIGLSLGFLGYAAATLPEQNQRYFCCALVLVGIAGILGSCLAERLPYALLFQGQPYRALWLVQLISIPVALQFSGSLWRSRSTLARTTSMWIIYLFALPAVVTAWAASMVLAVATWGHQILFGRRPDAEPENNAKPIIFAAFATFIALALPTTINASLQTWDKVSRVTDFLEPLFAYRVVAIVLGPGLLALLAAVTAARVSQWADKRVAVRAAAVLAAALLTQIFFFVSPTYLDHNTKRDADVAFVNAALPADRDVTVHWPHVPKLVWFDLQKNCFFGWQQTAGSMFTRETAIEAYRRAQLVARLDLATHNIFDGTASAREVQSLKKFYNVDEGNIEATPEDLIRVCYDPEVDFVVSRFEVDNLYRATNGRWFVYDCAEVRRSRFAADIVAAAR